MSLVTALSLSRECWAGRRGPRMGIGFRKREEVGSTALGWGWSSAQVLLEEGVWRTEVCL